MLGNPKTTHYIRILVACYLLYTSYSLAKGLITGDTDNKWFILAIVFFTVCSIFLIVISLKSLGKISKEEKEQAEKEALQNPVEGSTEKEKSMSISARARLTEQVEIPESQEEIREDSRE